MRSCNDIGDSFGGEGTSEAGKARVRLQWNMLRMRVVAQTKPTDKVKTLKATPETRCGRFDHILSRVVFLMNRVVGRLGVRCQPPRVICYIYRAVGRDSLCGYAPPGFLSLNS